MRLRPIAACGVLLALTATACADLEMAGSELGASRFVSILRDQATASAAASNVESGAEQGAGDPEDGSAARISTATTPRPVLRPDRDPNDPVATLSAVNAFVAGCIGHLSDPPKAVAEFGLLGFMKSPRSPRRFFRGALIAGVVTLPGEQRYVCYAGAPIRDFKQFVADLDQGLRRAAAGPVERSPEPGKPAWRLTLEDGALAVVSADQVERPDGVTFSLAKVAYDADGG